MGSDAQTLWIGSEGSQIIKKTGGSHCAGLTAPPHRNIRLSDETKKTGATATFAAYDTGCF
jgi:hypothetical protein